MRGKAKALVSGNLMTVSFTIDATKKKTKMLIFKQDGCHLDKKIGCLI